MILEAATLNPLILEAFARRITWLEASAGHPVDDFIDTFYSTRALMQKSLAGLTDEDVWFASPVHPFWTTSETITHLIYSQGFYHNKLLDITTSQLPHMIEAARGFGEGARPNVPAELLRARLDEATAQISATIEATRHDYNPDRIEYNTLFGDCTYRTWMLLLLSHEVDHVRQVIIMRRLVRRESKTP